jgi:hypothetical protein
MRLTLAAVLLFTAGPALAQDPKPNALTPKEAADGWLMLFDGETTFGWKIEGVAEVKDGELILGKGGKKTVAYPSTGFGPNAALSFQLTGPALAHVTGGTTLKNPPDVAGWVSFTVTRDGEKVQLGNTGPALYTTVGTRPKGSEAAPFCIETTGDAEVKVRSVKIRPTVTKPLFNGKDLSGWKVFRGDPKRAASKFEVTPAGELHVTSGPGDLQTEKQFDNFVLQLECKTNGKGLNSGVFFRCLPDQYQQGYEAQVHNAYKDDRTKPVDFGTGAIYRRVPARKVVSDDNEWFTLTVVADGPHIATWVNGYQTVDWTDDRKPADNPRQGLKTGKGHLSIQGHDPTTDLLFRNIRLAELPAGKEKKD